MNITPNSNNLSLEPIVSYQFNTSVVNNCQLVIVYVNMRSIVRRWSKLESNIASMNIIPDAIVISETWIYDDESQFYNLEGYSSFHSTRPRIHNKGRGGGTAILVRNAEHLQCNLSSSRHFDDANILVIKLISMQTHIVAIYKPEQTDFEMFLDELDSILRRYKNSYVVGDMNIDLLDNEEDKVRNYMEIIIIILASLTSLKSFITHGNRTQSQQ